MPFWRELFGFQPEDQPGYELVHDRWRERAKTHEADQKKVTELGHALGAARRELLDNRSDDVIHPEQLLPP